MPLAGVKNRRKTDMNAAKIAVTACRIGACGKFGGGIPIIEKFKSNDFCV